MSFSDLCCIDHSQSVAAAVKESLPPILPELVPSHQALGQQYVHRPKFKGVGEGGTGSEVFHFSGPELVKLYHPIATKSFALSHFPMQAKGGQTMPLYKEKGVPSKPSNSRDVMLVDEADKCMVRTSRPVYTDYVEKTSADTQWGSGLHGGSTEPAHMYVKSCIERGAANKQSIGIIFMDVQTAFALMIREFILQTDAVEFSPDRFLKFCKARGFSDVSIEKMRSKTHHAMNTNGKLHPHAAKVFGKLFSNTWGSTEGVNGVYKICTGSLAGTPLADLCFTPSAAEIFLRSEPLC